MINFLTGIFAGIVLGTLFEKEIKELGKKFLEKLAKKKDDKNG